MFKFFKSPTVEEMREKMLKEAELNQLQHEALAEGHKAIADMCKARVQRLKSEVQREAA